MPRSTGNQKLRLIYLAKLFCSETDEQHPISRDQLFELLESRYGIAVERKTFYDDLQYLELLGMDICKGKGRGTYYLANREFEMPELHLLVDAIQSSQFITSDQSALLIDKLTTLCSHHQGAQLKSQVYLATRNKTVNGDVYRNIEAIYRAITSCRQLSYRYYSWNFNRGKLEKLYRRDGARYTVSPLSVAWNDEKYYLIAYDPVREGLRHYRIDKMEEIRVEEEPALTATETDRFDSGSYTAKLFDMYGGKEQQVTLRFTKDLLGVAIDRFGKNSHLRPDDETHFRLITNVMVSPGFYGFLFSLQDRVELLEPAQCVDEFKKSLQNIQKLYKS